LGRLVLLFLIVVVLVEELLVLIARLLVVEVVEVPMPRQALVEHILAAMAAVMVDWVDLPILVAHLEAAVLVAIQVMVEKVQVLLMARQLLVLAGVVAVAEKLAEHQVGLVLAVAV
jgi:hypothetical protein